MTSVHFDLGDEDTVFGDNDESGGPTEKWGPNAVAYQLLAYDVIKGSVKKGMKPSAVQQRRSQFLSYDSKRFSNNLTNMLKRHREGKLLPKCDMKKLQQAVNAADKGKTGGGDATTVLANQFDGMAMFTDDESEGGRTTRTTKKKSYGDDNQPREIVVKKPKELRMILPFVMFDWNDSKVYKRLTTIVQLPSGAWLDGCVTAKIVDGQTILLTFDWSHIVLLFPDKYSKAFLDAATNRLYNDTHVKTVSHAASVKMLKGDSSLNLVKSTFTIRTPFKVENEFTNVEGWAGFTVLKMGDKSNPQIFAHMEMMGIRDGHVQSRITKFEDFTEDDDEAMAGT